MQQKKTSRKKTSSMRTIAWLIVAIALVSLVGLVYQARSVSAQTPKTHVMPDGSVMANDEGTMHEGMMMLGGHMRGMNRMMREHMQNMNRQDLTEDDLRAMHQDCMKMMQENDDD